MRSPLARTVFTCQRKTFPQLRSAAFGHDPQILCRSSQLLATRSKTSAARPTLARILFCSLRYSESKAFQNFQPLASKRSTKFVATYLFRSLLWAGSRWRMRGHAGRQEQPGLRPSDYFKRTILLGLYASFATNRSISSPFSECPSPSRGAACESQPVSRQPAIAPSLSGCCKTVSSSSRLRSCSLPVLP